LTLDGLELLKTIDTMSMIKVDLQSGVAKFGVSHLPDALNFSIIPESTAFFKKG
jgi:hypothetical protein